MFFRLNFNFAKAYAAIDDENITIENAINEFDNIKYDISHLGDDVKNIRSRRIRFVKNQCMRLRKILICFRIHLDGFAYK